MSIPERDVLMSVFLILCFSVSFACVLCVYVCIFKFIFESVFLEASFLVHCNLYHHDKTSPLFPLMLLTLNFTTFVIGEIGQSLLYKNLLV